MNMIAKIFQREISLSKNEHDIEVFVRSTDKKNVEAVCEYLKKLRDGGIVTKEKDIEVGRVEGKPKWWKLTK